MVIASALSVLLIAGLSVYLFIINSPIYKIYQAALNTKERIDGIFQNADQFSAWVDSVKQTYNDRRFALDLEYGKSSPKLELSLHQNQSVLSGALTYHFKDEKTLNADFSANETDLMFRLPDLLDKTFSVKLENLGDETANNSYFSEYLPGWVQALDGLDPDLFTDVSFEAYKAAHEDEISDLIDSVEAEEIDTQIPHAQGLTTYRIRLDTPLFTKLFLGYLHYAHDTRVGEDYDSSLNRSIAWFDELLTGKDLTFFFGIDQNDCLTALHLDAKKGAEVSTLTLVLSGENVIDFGLWYNGEQKYEGALGKQGSGFALRVNHFELLCDDDANLLTLLRNGQKKITLHFGLQGSHSSAELSYGKTLWKLALAPDQRPVSMLSDNPTDLLNMGFFDWLEVVAALAGAGWIKLW